MGISPWTTKHNATRSPEGTTGDCPPPFHNAKLRETIDQIVEIGYGEEAKERAKTLIGDVRQFIEDNKDEIEAISILYSRPHRAGLRYSQVKDLARRLSIKPQTLFRLWQAFGTVAPDKVDTGSGKHCKHIVDQGPHSQQPDD